MSLRAQKSRTLHRDLRAISVDGGAFSLMVGLGETYVPAFALAIGLSEVAAGWIVSLPLLAGGLLQLSSPWAVRRLGSHKQWVVLCAIAQSLVMGGYVAAAWLGYASPAVLFLIATLYWAAGLATGPAWNTWVGSVVPRRVRAVYFARRTRVCQACVLTGLIMGGLLLQWGRANDQLLTTFALIFLAAGLARGVSAAALASQSEPGPRPDAHRSVSLRTWMTRLGRGNDGRLLLYMLAVQVAVQVSGPFFTPYMLGQLEFSYTEYLILISVSFVAKAIVLPTVGGFIKRFGPQRMLWVGALGIIPLAVAWSVSESWLWLVGVQVVSGTLWAVYELCTFLLLFEHIDERERTSVLTIFNFMNACAMVLGALAGGFLLVAMGQDGPAYRTLFALSSILRVCTVILLYKLGRVTFRAMPLAVRPLAVRPNSGSLNAPLVSSMGESRRPDHDNR